MLEELGEDRVKAMLLQYSCPYNQDVEYFLHCKAIEFSKQSLTQTHLVYSTYKEKPALLGYYALCNKDISVTNNALSNTLRKRISKFGSYNQNLKKTNN